MFNMSFEILPTTFRGMRKRKSWQTHDRCVSVCVCAQCTRDQIWNITKSILTVLTESEREENRNNSLAQLRSCQLLPFSLMNIETTSYFLFWCALQHEIRTNGSASISCKLADPNWLPRLTVSFGISSYHRICSTALVVAL